jgi:uncharacterized Zn finger protein
MFEIDCDNCGSELVVDELTTMMEYLSDADYLVDDVGSIVEKTLQQYLVYRCLNCEKTYKLTYQDWEKIKRRLIAEEVMESRKQHMFREELNVQTINADNGVEFCGQCSGYFNDGTCLNDVIKQCTIRKKDV